jgi:hypothetical protein
LIYLVVRYYLAWAREGFGMGVASVKDSDIEKAAAMDDLDNAAKHIQDIAGITTGDVAGQCLNENRRDRDAGLAAEGARVVPSR